MNTFRILHATERLSICVWIGVCVGGAGTQKLHCGWLYIYIYCIIKRYGNFTVFKMIFQKIKKWEMRNEINTIIISSFFVLKYHTICSFVSLSYPHLTLGSLFSFLIFILKFKIYSFHIRCRNIFHYFLFCVSFAFWKWIK